MQTADLTFIPRSISANAAKPFTFDIVDMNGQVIPSGRRWSTAKARDKEIQRVKAIWESWGNSTAIQGESRP